MANFQTRVEDYIGTFADTEALSGWLTQCAKLIVDRLPLERAEKYSAPITDEGSGIDITQYRIYDAHKSGYQARKVSTGFATQILDADSIHAALTTDPAWYILNGKAYVKPNGGTLIGVEYPEVAYTQSTITKFPNELINAVILYAAIHGLLQNINTLLKTVIGGISYTVPTSPTAPTVPAFVYDDADFTNASYSDASYSVASYVEALVDTISATTISALGTAPFYNLSSFSGNFGTVVTPLDTNADIDLANAHLARVEKYLNEYQIDIQNELNKFNELNVVYQAGLQVKVEQARLDQQRLVEQARIQVELAIANTREKAQIALQNAIKTADIDMINKAKAAEIDMFNRSKSLEKDIINKSKELEEQVSEYSARLQKYSIEVQGYSSQVAGEVGRIQAIIAQYSLQLSGYFNLLGSLKTEYNELMQGI